MFTCLCLADFKLMGLLYFGMPLIRNTDVMFNADGLRGHLEIWLEW